MTRLGSSETRAVNVLVLQKGEEFFAYVFPDEAISQVGPRLKEDAEDPLLSFSWYDAAVLAKRIRELRHSLEDDSLS